MGGRGTSGNVRWRAHIINPVRPAQPGTGGATALSTTASIADYESAMTSLDLIAVNRINVKGRAPDDTPQLGALDTFPEPDPSQFSPRTSGSTPVETLAAAPTVPVVTLSYAAGSDGDPLDFQIAGQSSSLRALIGNINQNCQIVESDPTQPDQWSDTQPFGLTQPTLRWQTDGHLYNLYVSNVDTAQFLTETELGLALHNDGHYELVHYEASPTDVLINQETELGGALYPFLEQTNSAWSVVSNSIDKPAVYPRPGTFQMTRPTLRWVKDNKVEDLFIDGMTTEQFLAKTGLELSMDKGGFVLSKRLSRIMRPHFAYGSFPKEAVHVRYLEQTETEAKVWDGAGLI